jgi:hypothetical protein
MWPFTRKSALPACLWLQAQDGSFYRDYWLAVQEMDELQKIPFSTPGLAARIREADSDRHQCFVTGQPVRKDELEEGDVLVERPGVR